MIKLSPEKLKQYSYFSHMSDNARKIIAKKLIPFEVIAGTQIIREGASADFFYIVRSGEVDVIKSTRWGQAARIKTLKCGEGFGDMALLTCSPRDTSVIAKTKVKMYKLLKRDFDEIIHFDSAFTAMLLENLREFNRYNKLKTFQPFALLEPEKMQLLIDKLKEKKYEAGENIIVQGEPGDAYYTIKSGRVSVIRKEGSRQLEEIAVLSSGEGFGEEALIREKGRNATVQALDDTTVLVLEKRDFEEILKKSYTEWDFPEDIPADQREKSVFIDARVAPEYKEEHIEGALNIPIEVLRQKYDELDPAREYYTYCTSDSRGMAAAFLMKSMGFKVKAIRGGLGAWDGPVERENSLK
jgi:CRP-like cAMP-binding protein